ncbi:MAG: YceI family protein [Thermoanaerobaculia bacterium]
MRKGVRVPGVFALLLAGVLPALAATETFTFDRAHSLIGFRIRHVVTKVEGRFKGFTGTIWLDRANPGASKVELTIQAASIDTGVEDRDKDLRSPNFFDVEKYPTITFKSTKVEARDNDSYEVTGDFTLHGVTKTIRVPVKHTGFGKLGDVEKAGFEVALPLSRKEYGIDRGAPLLGDDVEINIQVESNKQSSEESKAPAKS